MAILFDWYELPEPKDKQREEKILHPRIRLNGSTTTDELRRRIQERSSLTESDVSAGVGGLFQTPVSASWGKTLPRGGRCIWTVSAIFIPY